VPNCFDWIGLSGVEDVWASFLVLVICCFEFRLVIKRREHDWFSADLINFVWIG
jgi:hypothetical protein